MFWKLKKKNSKKTLEKKNSPIIKKQDFINIKNIAIKEYIKYKNNLIGSKKVFHISNKKKWS